MLVLVAVLSLIPAPDMGGSDKLLHFVTYFMLSATFSTLTRTLKASLIIASGLIVYGILLEFAQGLTGYRMLDSLDMLANSTGVIFGLLPRVTPIPLWFRKLESRWL